ncbi:hypothetical protein E1A91_A01G025800v1 [Gossypium mustelinum]|uniref:SHSP domain-containing protein n=1 Tax=Gossypium mustelinum TaxID=34275 RepID=A0A5D3AAS7_GOSMU|nr:hypothetical protein E1A91_A01G025800v1 [Gossypium mustelinum]
MEIHPGVTRIVIRSENLVDFCSLDHIELDMWRFRLPEMARPELASAIYEDGELIVTVPKGELGGGMRNGNTNNNWLVLVQ